MISSKHSHTFAHFWFSARYQNRPKIVSKTASLLQALQNGGTNDIFPISGRLGFQTGSNMGPQNWPKIDPKLDKSFTNLYKPTRRSQNGPKPRKTYKNMQKSAKMVPTWPHHGTQILPKSMPKASPKSRLGYSCGAVQECRQGGSETLQGRKCFLVSLAENGWSQAAAAARRREDSKISKNLQKLQKT